MRLNFCVLCGFDDPAALEHHHYIPKSKGGSDDENNMFTVCGGCHGRIHDIERPLRLSRLVKDGQTAAKERSVLEHLRRVEQAQAKARNARVAAKEAHKRDLVAKYQARAAVFAPVWAAKARQYTKRHTLPPAPKPPKPVKPISVSAPNNPAIRLPRRTSFMGEVMTSRAALFLDGHRVRRNRNGAVLATVEPDTEYPNLYRVRLSDGRLTDVTNLSRAKDAALALAAARLETEELSPA